MHFCFFFFWGEMLRSCIKSPASFVFFLNSLFTRVFFFFFSSASFHSVCICFQVLLLSFSLLISTVQPGPYSQRSRPEYTETKGFPTHAFLFITRTHTFANTHTHWSPPYLCLSVPSRSLQSMDEGGRTSPPGLSSIFRGFEALRSLTEKLWARVDLPFSLQQDHSHQNDYWSYLRRKKQQRSADLHARA